jgi:hypothetical protein
MFHVNNYPITNILRNAKLSFLVIMGSTSISQDIQYALTSESPILKTHNFEFGKVN